MTKTRAPRLSRRTRAAKTHEGAPHTASESDTRARESLEPTKVDELTLETAARALSEPTQVDALALDEVARQLRPRTRSRRRELTLDEVARQLEQHEPAQSREDAPAHDHGPLDFALPARPIAMQLISGRGHYERVIAAVREAHTSVWIATANAKELMVEDSRARPGKRRNHRRGTYVSIFTILDELAERGVELRMLHAELPSGPFREELAHHPRLVAGGLALRRCPRVHMKAVIVDGALLYLGSANWTGAGLGAKGSGRRNFELGFVTDDAQLLDQVQAIYERVWAGGECDVCKLRDDCPGPLIELQVRLAQPVVAAAPVRRKKAPTRSQIRRRRVSRLI